MIVYIKIIWTVYNVCIFTEQMELGNIPKIPENVFGKENLSDCGFSSELLKDFCSPNPTNIQIIENIKFSNNSYTWSWQIIVIM